MQEPHQPDEYPSKQFIAKKKTNKAKNVFAKKTTFNPRRYKRYSVFFKNKFNLLTAIRLPGWTVFRGRLKATTFMALRITPGRSSHIFDAAEVNERSPRVTRVLIPAYIGMLK